MLEERLRRAAESIGPKVLVERVRSLDEDLGNRAMYPRHRTLLLGLMAGLGFLLALVGIATTTAYAVARRTQEIGIRMALGASAGLVVRRIVRDAFWPALLGLTAGIAAALYFTRITATFLFQITPHDPTTYVAVAVVVTAAALVAGWVPARRAAKVDPVTALRAE